MDAGRKTPEQKRAFRDIDGRLALDVVRHQLGARAASVPGRPPDTFPLTELTFQAVARKRGTTVGIKRSRRLLRRLVAARIITPAGSYPQAHGSRYRVRLYQLGARAGWGCAATGKRAVGRRQRVKRARRPRWWEHPLFGEPGGLPPPQLRQTQRRRMRSLDEVKQGFEWMLARDRAPA